jgi:hypothetical protein
MADEKELPAADTADTADVEEAEAVEGAEAEPAADGGDDGKQEAASWYAEELKRLKGIEAEKKRLEEQMREKERQIAIKDRALQAEKRKAREPAQASSLEDMEKRILANLKLEAELDRSTSTKEERELVQRHLESIVRTGDPSVDVQRARAVANAARLEQVLHLQAEAEGREADMAGSMLTNGMGTGAFRSGSKAKSTAMREAEAIMDEFSGPLKDAKKHLGKYLN